MKIVLIEDLAVSQEQLKKSAEELKKQGHELVYCPQAAQDADLQKEAVQDADVIITGSSRLYPESLEAARNLKYIDVAFTGFDHIPVNLATERGIPVSNASGYATEAVAELCLFDMIDLLRRLEPLKEAARASKTKAGIRGRLLNGKTVGIVGAGHIGSRVAEYAHALGAKTIGYRRKPIDDANFDEQTDLETLMKKSDVVSLHVPLNDSTKHMISEKELGWMKPDAVLINTARGPVLDTEALIRVLKEGRIAGAALDVFDQEPPLDPSDPLLDTPGLILTPHMGFDSEESMAARFDIVMDNLNSFLSGSLKNAVNAHDLA